MCSQMPWITYTGGHCKNGNSITLARIACPVKSNERKIMKKYDRVEEIDVDDDTVLVVFDDMVEFKVCKTETGYEFLFLESKTDTIDVAFSDNLEEFEN